MTSDAFWFEQHHDDVPDGNEWLSPPEAARLRALRIPKRAADWRLGRWTAKRALAQRLSLGDAHQALATIEIVAAASGAPVAFVGGRVSGSTISITHTHNRAACAIASSNAMMGCDLEWIEARSSSFIADYFTAGEQRAFASAAPVDGPLLATLFWSAKESALKALREGLRLDTREVEVTHVGCPAPWSHWSPLEVTLANGRVLQGWWRGDGEFVRTIVSNPGCSTPMQGR
jgi:4'-phosphopantetheinyl transferase